MVLSYYVSMAQYKDSYSYTCNDVTGNWDDFLGTWII